MLDAMVEWTGWFLSRQRLLFQTVGCCFQTLSRLSQWTWRREAEHASLRQQSRADRSVGVSSPPSCVVHVQARKHVHVLPTLPHSQARGMRRAALSLHLLWSDSTQVILTTASVSVIRTANNTEPLVSEHLVAYKLPAASIVHWGSFFFALITRVSQPRMTGELGPVSDCELLASHAFSSPCAR